MSDYEKLKEIETKILDIFQNTTHHLVVTELAKALCAIRLAHRGLDGEFFYKGIGDD